MLEKIENIIKDIVSTLQNAKLYSVEHARFKKYVDKTYEDLSDILKEKDELVLGIVGQELAYEKEIFFDLSRSLKPTIDYLKERGIEKIIFYRNLQKEELTRLFMLLGMRKDEIKNEPQEYLSVAGVRNIFVGKLQGVHASKDPAQDSSGMLYDTSLTQLSSSLDAVLNNDPIDYLSLRFSICNIMDSMINRYKEFLKLSTMKRFDVGTFTHTLNVAILSMYFSHKLGFEREEVLDIGTAAIFHDIGKLYISRRIIQKPERLTDKEFERVKSHVILGAEILMKYVDTLGTLPVVVCFEHHLKYDTKGYPRLSFFQKPHLASLIVSICDVYDALSQKRSYKNDYPPDMIYKIMVKDKEKAFEPELLDKFFNIMGVWPVGTVVVLSDSRIAVVREQNENSIFSPKVEVILPEDKKEAVDLKETAETLKIVRYINLFKEGKEYLHLI